MDSIYDIKTSKLQVHRQIPDRESGDLYFYEEYIWIGDSPYIWMTPQMLLHQDYESISKDCVYTGCILTFGDFTFQLVYYSESRDYWLLERIAPPMP